VPTTPQKKHLVTISHTRCDCEVAGMVLMRDLKRDIRLRRSKDMSVHVSTCTSYDFNVLMPGV
jgi:hypothetical protein